MLVVELVLAVAQHQRRLPHAAFPQQHHLEGVGSARRPAAAATAPRAQAAAATGKVGGRVVSSRPTPSLGAGYIVSRLGGESERLPRAGAPAGLAGPLVEPAPAAPRTRETGSGRNTTRRNLFLEL